ncbi:hypothetical protein M405DRAFT_837832 [Rhizopogon salebrosus TDB-379]|nr:hypothetical protein M405DRAFT_837832 [Rhizopogon salebrosus TDB-379]
MPVRLPSIFVPASQHLRSLAVTGLAASLSYDAASEILLRSTTSDADTTQSIMTTEANITPLVSKLSQMHGAALSLWQFMSIQAASIGQVHHAVLAPSESPSGGSGLRVAVKIHFPNIANSIVMKDEPADECDYLREANSLKRYGARECLGEDARFKVPWVWLGSTEYVLVMEHVQGVSIEGAVIGACLRKNRTSSHLESSSSTYGSSSSSGSCKPTRTLRTSCETQGYNRSLQLSLVDFGATREYKKEFMDNWLGLLRAAASEDRIACAEMSRSL